MAVIVCFSCAREEARQRNAIFCFVCAEQRALEQSRAISRVHAAVERGDMPPATAFQCVDCGAGAEHYDHRDYTAPLVVEPVCPPCNKQRGPALDSQMRDMPTLSAVRPYPQPAFPRSTPAPL